MFDLCFLHPLRVFSEVSNDFTLNDTPAIQRYSGGCLNRKLYSTKKIVYIP